MSNKMIQSRFDEGLAAYRAGQSLVQLHATTERIEAEQEAAYEHAETPEDRAATRPSPDDVSSLISGFLQGVLDDVRDLRRATHGVVGGHGSVGGGLRA